MVKENMWTARSIQVPDLDSVIKDVPARVCDNCGEYYLSEDVSTRIYALAVEGKDNSPPKPSLG